MKYSAIAFLLLVAQCALANPQPNPSMQSLLSTVSGAVSNVAKSANTAATGAIATVYSGITSVASSASNVVDSAVSAASNATKAAEAAVLSQIKKVIPNVDVLVGSVTNITSTVSSIQPLTLLSDITNIISAVKSGSTDNIINSVFSLISPSLYNTVITIPVKANDTSVGDFFGNISVALSNAKNTLQNAVTLINGTFTNLTDAAENFVLTGMASLNFAPGSPCWTAVNQAEQNFVKTLADNAEVCIYNVINMVSKDLATIDSLQREVGTVIAYGTLRLGLIPNIIAAATAIPTDFSTISSNFPVCEATQLAKSLLTLYPIVTGSLSCVFSGFSL